LKHIISRELPNSSEWRYYMKKKILIAGGDLRQLYCGARLSEKYDTAVIGFDKPCIPPDMKPLYHETGMYDEIILPVLPVDECGMLNTPCSEEKIPASDINALLKSGGRIFAGKVSENLKKYFPDAEIIDYMEREELNLLNAIPSAEGAVQLALEELPVTLNGLKVLVVGCGRIGTALIGILKGFGADVTVSVRSAEKAAKARILGAKTCCSRDIAGDFGLVFNTVPSMIFNRKLLEKFSSGTLFIDLASKPGGIDFEAAVELGIKAIWALGLPGKTAPITAGEIIADTVSGILNEKGGETDG
jgi:dipicolinate synthase subunit A